MDFSAVPHLRPATPSVKPPRTDPDVPNAAAWLAAGGDDPRAVVLGAPFGGGSLSRARTQLAPAAVRDSLTRFTVWWSDQEVSLEGMAVADAGDVLTASTVEETQERIEATVAAILDRSPVPVAALGGDNSVTVGLARGAAADGLLTFDAHHDCRDPTGGATNGSVVRQLVEGGLESVVQVGIHGFANGERNARWASDHGVHWFLAGAVRSAGIDGVLEDAFAALDNAERIWVDVDLDVLDRAFAPAAPAALPGGLWPSDLERAAFIVGSDRRVVGMDIVEMDPTADVAATTTRTACAVLLAFLAGVSAR